MRIFKLARECGVKSDAVIEFLNSKGIDVKNRMVDLDEDQTKLVLDNLAKPPEPVKKKKSVKRVVTIKQQTPSQKKAPARKKGKKRVKTRRDKESEEEEIRLKKIISLEKSRGKEAEEETKSIEIQDPIIVRDLAKKMNVDPAEVLKKLVKGGFLCTLNQPLDSETASTIALEFGFEAKVSKLYNDEMKIEEDKEEDLEPRSPIVTVMGHVDHGKTMLLDNIRKSDIISDEAGGITQHIGASVVKLKDGNKITFIDTPGHEAFTAMRARGAQITDIVILVVAADDGVMPQTVEAIQHAQSANCPIIVAVNKCDLPQAAPDKVKQQLTEYRLTAEEWGGETIFVNVSAKTGDGVEKLLEMIALQAEMMELKANPKRNAVGTIIEANIDEQRGILATVVVQKGTLKTGDFFVAGTISGKIKKLYDYKLNVIEEAGPSIPVLILGCSELPEVGDKLIVVSSDKEARKISDKRLVMKKEDRLGVRKKLSLEDLSKPSDDIEAKQINIILKADRRGSVEALTDMILRLSNDKVKIHIVASSVGTINDGDVLLASASNSIILGFQIRPSSTAEELAGKENIEIRIYDIIYNMLDEIKNAMNGILDPVFVDELIGKAEVREIFKVTKVGTVAGSYILQGKVIRKSKIKIIRDGVLIYDTKIATLRRFKDDVKEVKEGYECGIMLENYQDIKTGDILECYLEKEIKNELA